MEDIIERASPRNRISDDSCAEARLPPTVSARWSRDADVTTIARAILGTLKYEPHRADLTMLRRALESVVLGEGRPVGLAGGVAVEVGRLQGGQS
jgi:hypothetical protein